MLTLYYAKGTAALAPLILLEEAGAQYAVEWIDFSKGDQTSGSYLSVNPKGRVPSLVTDPGTLTEAAAILAYIAQTHPAARLAPEDPFGFAEAQAFNLYLAATVHVAHAHKMRGSRWADDPAAHAAMAAKVPETMTACTNMIEDHYLKGPWVLGDEYSMCDAYLFTVARWLPGDGVDLTSFPKLSAHMAAMRARTAVKKVSAAYL